MEKLGFVPKQSSSIAPTLKLLYTVTLHVQNPGSLIIDSAFISVLFLNKTDQFTHS